MHRSLTIEEAIEQWRTMDYLYHKYRDDKLLPGFRRKAFQAFLVFVSSH